MVETCNNLRAVILDTEKSVRELMSHECFSEPNPGNGEMKANIMLAVRHLEDARMRLGKVIQAKNGGVSCYDKPNVPEPPPPAGKE